MKNLKIDQIFDKYNPNEENIEEIILQLKDIGLSQMESTKVLMLKLKISLNDADKFIINSKAWKYKFQDNINLRENFFNCLNENYKDDL